MSTRRIEDCVPFEEVCRLVDCDLLTGVVTWKRREENHYRIVAWNKRFAGKPITRQNAHGYIQIQVTIDGVKHYIMAHRLLMAIANKGWLPTDIEIDHVNRITSDNRSENLRLSTRSGNNSNKALQSNNTSGFKGVYWYPRYNKWMASVSIANGKRKNLGYFDKIEDAVAAYDAAATQSYGEFSVTNAALSLA